MTIEDRALAYVAIRNSDTGATTKRLLGEFRCVWHPGVTLGSSAECTIQLSGPGILERHALVEARSNHKLLHWLPRDESRERTRIDYGSFNIGRYQIHFGEIGLPTFSQQVTAAATALAELTEVAAAARSAAPALMLRLLHPNPKLRKPVAELLARMGVDASGIVSPDQAAERLVGLLGDGDETIRFEALAALASLGVTPPTSAMRGPVRDPSAT